jgi:hypothetical protein
MFLRLAAIAILTLQSPMTLAREPILSPAHLAGTWSLAGATGCDSDTAGYVVFRDNATLELGTGKKARAAGFWELNNDTVILHMLVSPRAGDNQHPFYQDSYHYQYRAAQIQEVRENRFTASIGLPAEGNQYTLTRCQ